MACEPFNIQRVQANLKAIASLRNPKPDTAILKQYTGWGGLRSAIFNPDVYQSLKKYCTKEEIERIKQSTSNAYFTPKPLIQFIYDALLQLKRPFINILEPSAGHGLFFEYLPQEFKAPCHAVEIDTLSYKMLQALYPNVTLYNKGFETFKSDTPFDLIIGNPPYGQGRVRDDINPDIASLRIHHYFVAKCMRMLAADGVLAMVLPRYFLDNCKDLTCCLSIA